MIFSNDFELKAESSIIFYERFPIEETMKQESLITSMLSELADYIFLICAIDSALSWTAAEMRAHSVRFLLIMKFHLSAVCF